MRRITRTGFDLVEPLRSTGPEIPDTPAWLNARSFDFVRTLAFPDSADPAVWRAWRGRLRRALRRTLCLDRLGPAPAPDFLVLETVRCDGYRWEKVAYETLPGCWVCGYLLLPDSPGRKSAVLCPHGHVEGGSANVVGLTPPLGVAYAHEFARRGVVALAPDNAGMGARDASPERRLFPDTGCFLTWARLNQLGLDLTGFRVFELMAGLNLLARHPEVDAARIGCAGLSGGCWLSQVLAALDRRVRAVILSGYFTTFPQTAWHGHCICHHPFGIGRYCDMPDIAALIAPRPLFVESGLDDTYYPPEPAFQLTRRAYELQGAEERVRMHRYPGGHEFHGTESIPWMLEQLA